MPDPVPAGERAYRGIAVSDGVSPGRLVVLGESTLDVARRTISDAEISGELERLHRAFTETRRELEHLQQQVSAAMGSKDAAIFEAHELLLEDPVVTHEVDHILRTQHVNIEAAYHDATEKFATALEQSDDEYLRERAADMRDVATRVLRNLLGLQEESDLRTLKEPCLIIAHDLAPSTTARLDRTKVLGFATDIGSRTSHTAILARKLGIPAVVGLGDITRRVHTGEPALLDGYGGVLTVNPTDQTRYEYGQLKSRHIQLEERLRDLREQAAVTLDGVRLTLSANIEDAGDIPAVRDSGAEGVGLFRSEFLYLNRRDLPSEEEQFTAYREVAAALEPAPVVIRSLDLGGDKVVHPLHGSTEMNPFLGWRAIRVCLAQPELFRAQLRAVLRASAHGNVKLMYPMISNLEELLAANAALEACRAELRREDVPFNPDMEVGAMIEIPSAALVADALAKHVDFFSIGTNDLSQYTLAVDRLNERVAHLYVPTHPAILKLIHLTVEAGHQQGCWVGVCGETAGDPAMIPLLLGLGIDELSVTPAAVPRAKFLLRRLRLDEAKPLAEFALHCDSAAEIFARSEALARASAPGLFA